MTTAVLKAGGLRAVGATEALFALAAVSSALPAARACVRAFLLGASLATPASNALALARRAVALAIGLTATLFALHLRALQVLAVGLLVVATAHACAVNASAVTRTVLRARLLGAVL